MPKEQSSWPSYPQGSLGNGEEPKPTPTPVVYRINLAPSKPDIARDPGNGCLFFIFAPVMWIINRRDKLSKEPPTDFQS